MSCGLALKRPHDYEAYLSPNVEPKRPRPLNCSPFRPQLGTLAASLPPTQSPNSSNGFAASVRNSEPDSPFAIVSGKCQLSKTQLEDYLRAEVRYLKRRRLIPRRTTNGDGDEDGSNYRRGGSSPVSSVSGSDSEGEHQIQGKRSKFMNDLYERPQFSMNQVKMICERLLKEQETRLRYEYETVLNRKLEEKHQEYVQFAREQLENRPSSTDYSYLS